MHSMWLYLTVFTFCKCYENIALHKPAFQQYPFIDGEASYDASRAVDGLKSDLSWSGGCPTTGYYGLNCSVPCPDVNCQYCHIETGTCQGCKPGYKGHRCDLGTFVEHLVRTDTLVKTVQGNVSTPVLVVTIEMVYAITDVYPDGWATFVLEKKKSCNRLILRNSLTVGSSLGRSAATMETVESESNEATSVFCSFDPIMLSDSENLRK
uniref:Uncharacterized protein n=1 Tax=Magallana gigas TaxID=29159 RepID=A0A8W8MSS1_MAGGI